MSLVSREKLSCPGCGHKQNTSVWNSINVTLDPGLRKQLFDCEINIFKCGKCGKEAFIDIPLMYHDMRLNFCVQYYPIDALNDAEFFTQFAPDGSCRPEDLSDDDTLVPSHLAAPHIVFSMGEMLNYVRFREGLHTASSQEGQDSKP